MNPQIGYWGNWQIQLERPPVLTAIPRDVQTSFRAGKQKILAHVILADNARESVGGDSLVNLRPSRTIICGLVQSWRMVIELVARGRNVRGSLVVRRYFNRVD